MSKKDETPQEQPQPNALEQAAGAVPSVNPAIDTQAKLEEHRELIEKFQEQLFTKFKDYILSVALLPQRKEDEGKIPVLMLIDDMDSKKIPKADLRDKLIKIFDEEAKKVDERILPEVLLLSELWQYCYDGKTEVLQDLALSASTYDVGMLAAIRLAEVHKQLVMQKFEKYIMAYVLGGSLVQGTATTKSDVDVFIVIDDTDVKKMTRAELRDKLRAIIIEQGFQAGEMTGVKNKINIQPYLLTDFWDFVKEANPVIFTFLRDGVPFVDKGVFMPWKQLLEMGKVKPSQEAIDIFMSSGDQYLKRVRAKLREIGIEDFFWATTTPAQAAIMLYGYPPPTPKELAGVLRDLFVKGKEKLLDEKTVKIVEDVVATRKKMEHGDKADITGKEIDELYARSEEFLLKMDELFKKIQERKEADSVLQTYESTITLVRDVLKADGHEVKEADLLKAFDKEIVKGGHIPEKYSRILHEIDKAKKDYDKGVLTKSDVHDITKKGRDFFKHLLEHLQRTRGRELERAKIRVKHGEDIYSEVVLLDDMAFIIHNIQSPEKQYERATIKKDGGLGKITESTMEEYEKALANATFPDRVFIKEPIFEDLKKIFGKNVEVLVTQ